MSHLIKLDFCIGCGECAEFCPYYAVADCEGIYKIDPDECRDCGLCIGLCPSGAIIDTEIAASMN